ncbi:hypothetical protein CEXT_176211 [Caerostris extrusa]|uniref:Uncharacterized protein n=1 Tax=Caerostris extrusa TaxID=172846 RepID=A0AAV4US77_CAEEX|nr:hypothetical protein CEXT_176211 [Caerostris extrusa]
MTHTFTQNVQHIQPKKKARMKKNSGRRKEIVWDSDTKSNFRRNRNRFGLWKSFLNSCEKSSEGSRGEKPPQRRAAADPMKRGFEIQMKTFLPSPRVFPPAGIKSRTA